MRIAVAYVVVTHGPISDQYCSRFVSTWHEYPPGYKCDLIVGCNGGPLACSVALIFAPLNPIFYPRSNEGWDVGFFLEAAKGPCSAYDMMVCLGESNYFHREGWLKRLVEAWNKYGPGMYSPYSSNAVRAHMNTTAFCCAPFMLRQYQNRVFDRKSRYEFEHGERALWRRVAKLGLPVKMVTWDGEYSPGAWRLPPNILWRGDQTNCLMWCNHADGYANADWKTKMAWARRSDAAFR